MERVLKGEYEHFRLIGRLDRVDERADGVLEIVDYKSGRTEVSSDDVVADLAMGCYQLLLSKLHPGRPMVATIVALRSGARASCGFSPEELAEFERDLVKLGDQIVTDEIFDRLPSWKPLCAQCDFLTLCRRHPDFDEPPSEVARG
ncbi:MAG: PD-(D/E)XK nuclease family protein, partial [Fimbriimonas ginsengisoli]|nr:PD-(D/E)XK nuclease family protein [Fimbriimonas ginsengisoli]